MLRMFSLLSLDTPAYSASTASLASTANEPSRAWTRKYTKRFAVALSPRPLLSRQLIVGKPTPRHAPERLSEPVLVLTLSLVGYSERSSTGAWVSVTRRLNRPLSPIAVLRPGSGRQGRYAPLYTRHLLPPPLLCAKPSSSASSLATNSSCSVSFISILMARRRTSKTCEAT